MAAIRFFTDEDIYGAVATALRHLGIDAVSTPESGRRGESDVSQLHLGFRHPAENVFELSVSGAPFLVGTSCFIKWQTMLSRKENVVQRLGTFHPNGILLFGET